MITASGLSQISVVSYRAVSIAILIGVWLSVKKGMSVFRTSREMLTAYALLGILTIIFNSTGFMMSCVYISVPQALMLGYTSPIVTMAGSAFLTGEKPTPVQVIAGFMVLLGLYIGFVMGTESGGPISLVGVAWAGVSVTGSSGPCFPAGFQKRDTPIPCCSFSSRICSVVFSLSPAELFWAAGQTWQT
jgi:drug/metabolite transporter (DMT)-like permease